MRGGQQRGVGFFEAVQSLQYAAEIHQDGAAFGDQPPRFFVVFGGELQFVALFGEGGQLEVGAEIVRAELDGFGPASDAFGQGAVDILKGALGGGARFGIAGLADAIEDAAGLGLLLGFVTKKCVFQGHMEVFGVEQHGLAKLAAGGLVFADLEIGISEILAHCGTGGGGFDGLEEEGDGVVVAARAQGFIGFIERLVARVGGLGDAKAGCQACREKECS